MKKPILKILMILSVIIIPIMSADSGKAEVLQGGIAMSDRVPKEFFGDWRVVSKCVQTTNEALFGGNSLDIWTLTRYGDVIVLSNPLSGARAEVTVNEVKGQTVKFEKKTVFPGEESYETPILTLNGDRFTGVDKINIKTFRDGKLIREDFVTFEVKGTKISGNGLDDIFGK